MASQSLAVSSPDLYCIECTVEDQEGEKLVAQFRSMMAILSTPKHQQQWETKSIQNLHIVFLVLASHLC